MRRISYNNFINLGITKMIVLYRKVGRLRDKTVRSDIRSELHTDIYTGRITTLHSLKDSIL